MQGTLYITGDEAADVLLNRDGTALLIGMLLDQQVPMEWAFKGPATLRERLGHLDASKVAAMDREELVAVFCQKPALHRFPAAMGRRCYDLCVHLSEQYGGKGENLWADASQGDELLGRLRAIPGFGEEKAKIFLALLAKRFAVRPEGWEDAAHPFADALPRSVADSDSPEAFARVREWKKAAKAAKRDKQDRPLSR